MILIKKILNKLFTSMLLLVTAFACAFAIPARKTLASAATNPEPIPNMVIATYTESTVSDLQLVPNGDPLCFMLDSQLFERAETRFTITSSTTLSDINASPVIQTLAVEFADKLNINYVFLPNGLIDAGALFSFMNLHILIHESSTNYLNVTTGWYGEITDYVNLGVYSNCNTSATTVYSMQVFRAKSAFYSLLVDVQQNHEGAMHNYALDWDNAGHRGTLNVNIYQH